QQSLHLIDLKRARYVSARLLRALPRSVEVDAAQLQTVTDLPDAVEHEPMTLIGFRERPFAAGVVRHREWHFGETADRRRVAVPSTRPRVGERTLPAMADSLRHVRLQ